MRDRTSIQAYATGGAARKFRADRLLADPLHFLFVDAGDSADDQRFLIDTIQQIRGALQGEGRLLELAASHPIYSAYHDLPGGFPGEQKREILRLDVGDAWYCPRRIPCDEPAAESEEAEDEEAAAAEPTKTPYLRAATNVVVYAMARPGQPGRPPGALRLEASAAGGGSPPERCLNEGSDHATRPQEDRLLLLGLSIARPTPAQTPEATRRADARMQILMGTLFGAITFVSLSRSDHPGSSESRHDRFALRNAAGSTLVGAQLVYVFGDRRSRKAWAWTTVAGLAPMGLAYLAVRSDRDCRRRQDDDCGLAGDLAGAVGTLLAPTSAWLGYRWSGRFDSRPAQTFRPGTMLNPKTCFSRPRRTPGRRRSSPWRRFHHPADGPVSVAGAASGTG
jgi:hypothetical protein